MDILAAIKREERKLERELTQIQQKLNGIRGAAKAIGHSTNRQLKEVKKRVLSAAGRAKIAAAARKRWAKVRAQAKKAA
jgi:DNA repair exonuclease SbcCD ATPase subunit